MMRFLRNRKARAFRILLPPGTNGEKTGLDDFFARGGTADDLTSLVERPQRTVAEKKKKEENRTDREARSR